MKVYIVTSGSYSSYEIRRIFSSKDKADQFIKLHNPFLEWYSKYNEYVEVFDIDKEDNMPKDGYPLSRIYMNKDGDVIHKEFLCTEEEGIANHIMVGKDYLCATSRTPVEDLLLLVARPWPEEDYDRLVKIANEIRGQLLANDQFKG